MNENEILNKFSLNDICHGQISKEAIECYCTKFTSCRLKVTKCEFNSTIKIEDRVDSDTPANIVYKPTSSEAIIYINKWADRLKLMYDAQNAEWQKLSNYFLPNEHEDDEDDYYYYDYEEEYHPWDDDDDDYYDNNEEEEEYDYDIDTGKIVWRKKDKTC